MGGFFVAHTPHRGRKKESRPFYPHLEMQHGHAQLANVADEFLHFRAQQKAQQDEHHAQKDIFAHAARGADLERELVLAGKGVQGDARRGQHVQHHMAQAAHGKAHTDWAHKVLAIIPNQMNIYTNFISSCINFSTKVME